jgi:2EXR family
MLPLELQLKIWEFTIKPAYVDIHWDSTQRVFASDRKIPALLHVSHASRREGLKHYRLSFASSPEFARVYFNFELDTAYFTWSSLGAAPGRLGRKLGDEDCKSLQSLLVNECHLLSHAQEGLRELGRFTNLKSIGVVCDSFNPQVGEQFGEEELTEYSEVLDEGIEDLGSRKEKWPSLVCLRTNEDEPVCSRHWWFDGWNQRAGYPQREVWPKAMAKCLEVSFLGKSYFFLPSRFLKYGFT